MSEQEKGKILSQERMDSMVDMVVNTAESVYQSGKRAYEKTPVAEEKRRKKIMAKIKNYGEDECVLGGLAGGFSFWAGVSGSPMFLGVTAISLGVFLTGLGRKQQGKRMMAYWKIMQGSERMSIEQLSTMTNSTPKLICRDIQTMLDKELLREGFLDREKGLLVLKDVESYIQSYQLISGLLEEGTEEEGVLEEIRQISQSIKNPHVLKQIGEIREITGRILAFEEENGGQVGELERFLHYYLPTTLKLLRSYCQLESQNLQGEHISKSMGEIQAILDQVVVSFETQLDTLFQRETMDIATDIAVLEQMLEKDGLLKQGKKQGGTSSGKGDIHLKL